MTEMLAKMSPHFEIVEAKPWHCGQMLRILRAEHRNALAKIGSNPHAELRRQFAESSFRKAWLIDGKLAALGGVNGMMLSGWGFIWLVLSEQARRYPIAIVKEARRQLDEIMIAKRELSTTILPDDAAARRLAIYLGFHVADEGPGAPAYCRRARRELFDVIDTTPDARIPLGAGFVFAMGYHEGAP